MSNLWGGPDEQLLAMMDRAAMVDRRLMPEESDEQHNERVERMIAAGSYDALEQGDKDWLNQAILIVSAGGSPRLAVGGDDLIGGDWAAEDAALDAGAAMPVVLDPDEGDTDTEPDVKSFSDDEWVGV